MLRVRCCSRALDHPVVAGVFWRIVGSFMDRHLTGASAPASREQARSRACRWSAIRFAGTSCCPIAPSPLDDGRAAGLLLLRPSAATNTGRRRR